MGTKPINNPVVGGAKPKPKVPPPAPTVPPPAPRPAPRAPPVPTTGPPKAKDSSDADKKKAEERARQLKVD